MREDEAGPSRTPWRWHPWFKRISNAAAHISAASLLAAGVANSLAARKHKSRADRRDRRDDANSDEDGAGQNREDNVRADTREDRGPRREHTHGSDGDADRDLKQERHGDASSDVHSAATTPTPTPIPTPTPGPGGGGGGGHGGGTNAGSGAFNNPLATKARRRAHDFDNANHDHDDDRTVVDVHPDGESVYHTHSVSLTTSPDGLEIVTNNITYSAEATPTPEPHPVLELPTHDPGFPFGEDFPFGNSTVVVAPRATEPPDPGDTGTTTDTRAKPIFSSPDSSDGGDNSIDFVS